MRAKTLLATGALALTVAAAASAAPATLPRLGARLVPSQEVPRQTKPVPNATGSFTAGLHRGNKGYRLVWRLTYARLSGKAMSAYIHEGRRGTHGAAFVFLCAPCRSGAHGSSFFSPSELALGRQGRLYVNVRTAMNPAGEIRGQISVK